MLEKFDKVKYESNKQVEEYNLQKSSLSEQDKYNLIGEIIKENFWGYFQLTNEILLDIASPSERYILLLSEVYSKSKKDMAQGPFLTMLIKIGREKPEVAITLFDKIEQEEDEDLKIISGLILGGYSIKNDEHLKELMTLKPVYPLINTILKAVFVKYEKSKIEKEIYAWLERIWLCEDERVLSELANLSLVLYESDKNYFYKKIIYLAEKKITSVTSLIFWRLSHSKLKKEEKFYLLEICKDSEPRVINEMINILIDYPNETERIGKLLIYWINRDLMYEIQFFRWAIEEISKKNPKIIEYFFSHYKELDNKRLGEKAYFYLFSELLEVISKVNLNESVNQLLKSKIYEEDIPLFCGLSRKIVGNIYNNQENFDGFLPLATKIHDLAKQRNFVDYNKKRFVNSVKRKDFEDLVNYIHELLDQIPLRKEDYDMKKINSSLSEFKELKDSTKKKLNKIYSQKVYSPLFWLGESGDKSDVLKKSYLSELNKYLLDSKEIKNQKFKDNKVTFLNSLGNENQFWEKTSEIFFSNKFLNEKSKFSPMFEPKNPFRKSNNFDLVVSFNNKRIYFEIKKVGLNRNLELDNGAVGIKNKARKAIDSAYRQIYSKPLIDSMNRHECLDYFFVVLDLSSSSADEHDVIDALYGSLAFQWFQNKITKEITEPQLVRNNDSLPEKNKNTSVLSGVIFFKSRLENERDSLKLKLRGDIVINPHAINKPSDKEIKELKEVIFS